MSKDSKISIMDDIVEISLTGRPKAIQFRSGEKIRVEKLTADLLATTYYAMNSEQEKKFDNFISKNKKNFNATLKTIYRNLK